MAMPLRENGRMGRAGKSWARAATRLTEGETIQTDGQAWASLPATAWRAW